MRRSFTIFIFLLLITTTLQAERKRVGLVLSGGGAKGVAHIGVLKVLEKAGIPIDYIAGTSMGSIVGGLYAIGYDAKMLDSLVRLQDWTFLLSDKVYRYNLPFSEKETNEKYLVSVPIVGGKKIQMPSGFISGQNIYNLFSELTIGYHDSLSFLKLPIPFSCVAGNLVNGKAVVLNSGSLPLSMRASMAIPGAFAPVVLDSMVLVDGGIANNFPTNVVLDMGAEIIIGVDVSSGLKDLEGLNSIVGIIDQLTSFMGMATYQENIKLVDLYIKPDIVPYSAASFSIDAIDTLIRRGEEVALSKWGELMELKKKIGLEPEQNEVKVIDNKFIKTDSMAVGHIILSGIAKKDERWVRKLIDLKEFSVVTVDDLHRAIAVLYGTGAFSNVSYVLHGESVYDLTLILKEKPMSSLNLGFRFDSEEMAAILLNTTLNHKNLRGSQLSITGRLSMNPYVKIDYSLGNTFLRRAGLSYMYKYNDFNIYERDSKVNNVTFSYHLGELNFSDIYIRNCKFALGLRYEYFAYDEFLSASTVKPVNVNPEGFFSYFALAHYETYDKRYYPTKGVSFKAEYSLYTDNMVHYKKGSPFGALAANFASVIQLTRRVALLPSIYGRVLMGNEIPYPYLNSMGGQVAGRYMAQQMSFPGMHNLELFDNTVIAAKLGFRYRLGAKHYVSLKANYAKQSDDFFDILKGDDIWGGSAGYSYNSIIGPVDILLDLSNWDKKLGFYFNLGYYF